MDHVGARMRRALAVLAVASAAFAIGSNSASAATASIGDPIGDNGQSFGTEPTDIAHVNVGWDGNALTLSVAYVAPQFDSLNVLVSDAVDKDDDTKCADYEADSLTIGADSTAARLRMPNVDGSMSAAGSWAGSTVTYVFSSPVLTDNLRRSDPFTCASGASDGDEFFGGFGGKILKITPANASAALTAELTRRFGTSFTRAARKWLKCPKEEIMPESEDSAPAALCDFEFSLGHERYRGGGTTFVLVSGVLSTSYFRSRTYTKTVRICRIAATKGGWVNGVRLTDRKLRAAESLGRPCSWLVGGAGIAGDIEAEVARRYPRPMPKRYTLYQHGTNRAGFQDEAVFPCRVSKRGARYTFRCSNNLGDRLIYSFTVTRRVKPKAKPPSKAASCDPNYKGACLKPNVSDCDCAGGSGNGPYYVQGPITVVGDDHYDLDSDHNGTACES
jgi:hypothetical protein